MGKNWERTGNVRFAVTCGGGDAAAAQERCAQVAREAKSSGLSPSRISMRPTSPHSTAAMSRPVMVEYDKLIDRQMERAAITTISGYAKIFEDASRVLSI